MIAPVLYNVVAGFRNAGVGLIMDDDGVIRSNVTPHIVPCLVEPVIREELLGLAEKEKEDEALNVQEYILRMSGRLGEGGEA
jgi:hypothetical protein